VGSQFRERGIQDLKRSILFATGVAAFVLAFSSVAVSAGNLAQASGQGTLDNGARKFSFSARTYADGSVSGQANLTNRSFTGVNGNSPYQLHIDISCMKVVGNIAFFGGTVKRTNDPSLVDAVYFSVQDNGEPGKNNDRISRVAFFDDDPNTTGDPALCMFNTPDDGYLPLETIESGNIQVKG
jgi:hypothetical protein